MDNISLVGPLRDTRTDFIQIIYYENEYEKKRIHNHTRWVSYKKIS